MGCKKNGKHLSIITPHILFLKVHLQIFIKNDDMVAVTGEECTYLSLLGFLIGFVWIEFGMLGYVTLDLSRFGSACFCYVMFGMACVLGSINLDTFGLI